MRHYIVIAVSMLVVSLTAALAATASATITPTRSAQTLAASLADPLGGSLTGSAFTIIPPPPPAPECANGIDDDFDEGIDFGGPNPDSGCFSAADNKEQNDRLPQCSNGLDDDFDASTDYPADSDCASATDDLEGPGTNPTPDCSNGVDDDGDGKTDLTDPGCSSAADITEDSEGAALQDTNPVAVSTTALTGFPRTGGDFAIMTSGNATLAANAGGSASQSDGGTGGTHGSSVNDLTTLRVDVNVPAGANCLSLDFRFLSEEYPTFVGSTYNDGFTAELDTSDFTVDTANLNGIQAPHNFAFDASGKVVSINTTGFSAPEAAGTVYNGASPLLRASTPVTPGAHAVYLSVFDQGDQILDSAAFIDNLRAHTTEPGACVAGATSDFTGSTVTLTTPPTGSTTEDSTPTFAGAAGNAPGDAASVTVNVFAGASISGAPVQSFAIPTSGGSFSGANTAALAPGTYTARAQQIDSSGNIGVSSANTFNVVAPRPVGDKDQDGIPDNLDTNDGSISPIPGKTVNLRVISGVVYLQVPGNASRATTIAPGPQKGFVPLKGAVTVPIGSQVDVEEGKIGVRSAADLKGKTQSAAFYAGIFQIKQKRAAKAMTTDLTVRTAASRFKKVCGPTTRAAGAAQDTRATAAARKKKRRKTVVAQLWGDGKGNFKTVAKSSAATVRGTWWLTQERCDGTVTRVKRGRVAVRDFGRKRSVTVRAGKSYWARATRAQLLNIK